VTTPSQYKGEATPNAKAHLVKSVANSELDSRIFSDFKNLLSKNEEESREEWLQRLRVEKSKNEVPATKEPGANRRENCQGLNGFCKYGTFLQT
jgi:hypothetical protein